MGNIKVINSDANGKYFQWSHGCQSYSTSHLLERLHVAEFYSRVPRVKIVICCKLVLQTKILIET